MKIIFIVLFSISFFLIVIIFVQRRKSIGIEVKDKIEEIISDDSIHIREYGDSIQVIYKGDTLVYPVIKQIINLDSIDKFFNKQLEN